MVGCVKGSAGASSLFSEDLSDSVSSFYDKQKEMFSLIDRATVASMSLGRDKAGNRVGASFRAAEVLYDQMCKDRDSILDRLSHECGSDVDGVLDGKLLVLKNKVDSVFLRTHNTLLVVLGGFFLSTILCDWCVFWYTHSAPSYDIPAFMVVAYAAISELLSLTVNQDVTSFQNLCRIRHLWVNDRLLPLVSAKLSLLKSWRREVVCKNTPLKRYSGVLRNFMKRSNSIFKNSLISNKHMSVVSSISYLDELLKRRVDSHRNTKLVSDAIRDMTHSISTVSDSKIFSGNKDSLLGLVRRLSLYIAFPVICSLVYDFLVEGWPTLSLDYVTNIDRGYLILLPLLVCLSVCREASAKRKLCDRIVKSALGGPSLEGGGASFMHNGLLTSSR